MKMQLFVHASGQVTINYDADGARISRTFTAPTGKNGYVRELDGRGDSTQPCRGLCRTGDTLIASRENLPATIRREYRRRLRMQAAELARTYR